MRAACPNLRQAAWREGECDLTGVSVDARCPELIGESGRAECLPRLALRYLGGDATALDGIGRLGRDAVIQAARMIQQRRGLADLPFSPGSPSEARRLRSHGSKSTASRWTAAEIDVMTELRVQGLTFRQIGETLGISGKVCCTAYHRHLRGALP